MTEEPWNKHTPGDPMPCKCGDSVVEAKLHNGDSSTAPAEHWDWDKIKGAPDYEIANWRFVERKGEDVIAADPYPTLEWDEDDTTIVVMEKPGLPWWVREDDLVRFWASDRFQPAGTVDNWPDLFAFQIKRRPILTPAEPPLLAVLAAASDDEADAIRSAARRANIEVPE